MDQHITRLSVQRAQGEGMANAQQSFKERLDSYQESRWPLLRETYFQARGIKVFAFDDAQLECVSLQSSSSQKSGSYLLETNSIPRHWSGSSSGSVSSSHSYSSSLPEDSSSESLFARHRRRSSHIDDVRFDIRKRADELSAALARLGLYENGDGFSRRDGGDSRRSGKVNSARTPTRRQSESQRGNIKPSRDSRKDHRHSDDEQESSEVEERQLGASPEDGQNIVYFLACPYVKNDPETYVRCNFREMRNISILKQHLKRDHGLGSIYCTTCLEHFNTKEHLDAHKEIKCVPKLVDAHHSKSQQIGKRRKGQNHRDAWNHIYHIIFPNTVLPASPYVGDESWKHLNFLFESLGRNHTEQLMSKVKSQRRHTTSDVEAGSMRLIAAVADALYDQHESKVEVTTEAHDDDHQVPVAVDPVAASFNISSGVYHQATYPSNVTQAPSFPQTTTSVTGPTLRRSTRTTFNPIPILEDDNAPAGSISQYIPSSVRHIQGGHAQRQMNQLVNPGYRHSCPDTPAEPWAQVESRPLSDLVGMDQVNMQNYLEREASRYLQENQIHDITQINPPEPTWNTTSFPNFYGPQTTRNGQTTRRPTRPYPPTYESSQ